MAQTAVAQTTGQEKVPTLQDELERLSEVVAEVGGRAHELAKLLGVDQPMTEMDVSEPVTLLDARILIVQSTRHCAEEALMDLMSIRHEVDRL